MIEKRPLTIAVAWLIITILLTLEPPAHAEDFLQPRVPAIVGLVIKSGDAITKATGFWISNRLIMTAKHLVKPGYAPEPCPEFRHQSPIEHILIFDGRPSTDNSAKLQIGGEALSQRIIEVPDVDIALLDVLPNWSPATLPIDTGFQLINGRTIVNVYGFPRGDPGIWRSATVVNRDVNERNYFAIKASLQEGYSGSPVLNEAGHVIGVDSCGFNDYEYIAQVSAAKNQLPSISALGMSYRPESGSNQEFYRPTSEPWDRQTWFRRWYLPLYKGTWIVLVASGMRTEQEALSVVAQMSRTFPDLGFHEGRIPDGRGGELFAVLLGTGLRQGDADNLVKYAKSRRVAPDAYKLLQTFDAY